MRFFYFLLFFSSVLFSQNKINKYKYIIVDKQFDFVKQPDKYQTSSLTKFLFDKEGFITFIEGEKLPHDLLNNRCLALKATVKDASSMFTTKNQIQLRDCSDKVIFTSMEGKSKIKEYKKAYSEAIRRAFSSVKSLNYQYKPEKGGSKKEVYLNEAVGRTTKVEATKNSENTNKIKSTRKANNKRDENPFATSRTPVLYAKRIQNGFQLMNAKKEVTFTVLKTNLQDVFIIENLKGVLYKENTTWNVEYYTADGVKVVKDYDVRMESNSKK